KWPRAEAKGALLAPVPPLRELVPSVPPHVAGAIDRAVSIEADTRPTASELADLLAEVHRHDLGHVLRAAPPPRALRWQPWAIGGAIVLAIILAIALRKHGDSGAKPTNPMMPSEAPTEQHTFSEDELPPVGQIQAKPPANMSEKAAHDWEKVMR